MKWRKPRFDEEYSRYLDQRKEVKKQWLQDPTKAQQYLSTQASRHLGNREKEYLKAKIDELEINSTNKHIRDLYMCISHFEKCYQPRISIAEDEKSDLVTNCHNIFV